MESYISKKTGLIAKISGDRLDVNYTKKAYDLPTVVRFLRDCGLLQKAIDMARAFDRAFPYRFIMRYGHSGSLTILVETYRDMGAFEHVPVRNKVLHISCAGNLNEGVSCFAPDFIAFLWWKYKDQVYEVLRSERDEDDIISFGELPEDVLPAGNAMFFPLTREDELIALMQRFQAEARACKGGTLSFLRDKRRSIPEPYVSRISDDLRQQIQQFTEQDWEILWAYARNIDLPDPPEEQPSEE